ncbi:hypothetical protein ABIC83_002856 [Roseateles asaccharophilus]|uniref:hypothetical protein n=1 Tax=Roseateles asaccharophilus TaxID=582607 RepID=UPI0038330404
MTAKKLTAAERRWLDDLQALFAACPSTRLGCYTVGDACLTFYDKNVETAWRNANGDPSMDISRLHELAGSELGSIETGMQIDSGAG